MTERRRITAAPRRAVQAVTGRAAEAVARAAISQGAWPKTGSQLMTEIGAYVDQQIAAHNQATTAHGIDTTRAVLSDDIDLIDVQTEAEWAVTSAGTPNPRIQYNTPAGVATGGGTVTTYVSAAFGGTITDGWGSPDTGAPFILTGTAADFDVAGGFGTINLATLGATRAAAVEGTTWLDQTLEWTWKVSALPVGGTIQLLTYGRRAAGGGNSLVRAVGRLKAGGAFTLALEDFAAATTTTVAAESATLFTAVAGTLYRTRLTAIGANPTTLSAMTWADGAAVPSPQVTGTTSLAAVQSAAGIGIGAFPASTITNLPIVVSVGDLIGTGP